MKASMSSAPRAPPYHKSNSLASTKQSSVQRSMEGEFSSKNSVNG